MQDPATNSVALRKFPYPFRAACTICSDLDGTKTAERFLSIQAFLNTEQSTEFGPGLGLEIGNSFFPVTRDDSFSYLSSRPNERAIIRDLIRAGYVDCIHSYEYQVRSRQDILRVLDALAEDDCHLSVWVNHSSAPTNFHAGGMPGSGDVPGSPFYHADLAFEHGIRFVWIGRTTSVLGQDSPPSVRSLRAIYDPHHPRETSSSIVREIGKALVGRLVNSKFAIHRDNRLLRQARLLDGRTFLEFDRWSGHWSPQIPDSTGLPYVLQRRFLDQLLACEGYAIIYTHLGRGKHQPILPPEAQAALRELALSYREGDIYVATTERVLRYCMVHRYMDWTYTGSPDGCVEIRIHHLADPILGPRPVTPEELQGITFYVPDPYRASVYLDDCELPNLVRNPKDDAGRASVMIPRTALTYPFA